MRTDHLESLGKRDEVEERAQLAGLVDDASGLLGVTLLADQRLLAPDSVDLRGGEVCWHYAEGRAADEFTWRDATGLLDRLLGLRDGSDVVGLVQRFGPIGFCMPHGLPIGFKPRDDSPEADHRSCEVSRPDGTWLAVERVEDYLGLAKRLRAALSIGIDLKTGDRRRLGEERAWRDFTLGRLGIPSLRMLMAVPAEAETAEQDYLVARFYFSAELNEMAEGARLQPSLDWSEVASVSLTGDLFGLAVLQLMSAIAGSQTLLVCSACGGAYRRTNRRPVLGRRNYCPECRATGRPQRDAKRDQRSRQSN